MAFPWVALGGAAVQTGLGLLGGNSAEEQRVKANDAAYKQYSWMALQQRKNQTD